MSNIDVSDLVTNGWFAEKEVMWPGQRFSLQVKRVLHREKSAYQVSPSCRSVRCISTYKVTASTDPFHPPFFYSGYHGV